MKKIVFVLFVFFSVSVFAQVKPLVSSSIIAFNKNDLVEAKKYIDQASEKVGENGAGVDEKTMSKYLYYKGMIYYRMSLSDKEEIKSMAPNGPEVAAEYFLKLFEHEKNSGKNRFTDDAMQQIPYVANSLKNEGYNSNESEDFEGAANFFMMAYDLQKNPALNESANVDTLTYYYAGLSYNAGEMYPKAIEIMKDVLNMGYNGYTFTATNVVNDQPVRFGSKAEMERQVQLQLMKDPVVGPSERPNVYKSLLSALIATADTAGFQEYLMKAREEFPDDESLIRLELQGYLDAEEYEKALGVLDLAISKDPNNSVYYYVKGFILQTEVKDDEKAIAAYTKATELDPENFDAYFMSGVVYYDQGKAALDEMNQLGMSKADQKKYDELNKVKVAMFEKSLPFFEKAYELNPEDLETVKALWETYRQLKNREKTMEMKAKLDELSGPQPE
jgi:tetratricopeptide (TPR) repeat protein